MPKKSLRAALVAQLMSQQIEAAEARAQAKTLESFEQEALAATLRTSSTNGAEDATARFW